MELIGLIVWGFSEGRKPLEFKLISSNANIIHIVTSGGIVCHYAIHRVHTDSLVCL